MDSASLKLFAAGLADDDQVALEVSGNAWEVVRIIGPHVGRVVAATRWGLGSRRGDPRRCAGALSAAASWS
jgi:hypothetical protein